jgi:two-component system NarL family sensor kinase
MEKNEIFILISTFTVILLILGVFLLLFYLLFKQKQKKNQLKIAALNEQLLETQIEIQEQTLKNVSEEIHDNIGQVLSLAKLNLATFINITDDNHKKLSDTRNLVSKAINDLRDLGRSMHGDKIAEMGLQNAVETELKFLQNTGKFQAHLSMSGISYKLKPQVQMVLFRIVQEALHNEIKHSKAKNISVHFTYDDISFSLTLQDDGVGFDFEKLYPGKSGIGLQSMKKRAALIGGEFSIYSSENNGTTVIIKLPKTVCQDAEQTV